MESKEMEFGDIPLSVLSDNELSRLQMCFSDNFDIKRLRRLDSLEQHLFSEHSIYSPWSISYQLYKVTGGNLLPQTLRQSIIREVNNIEGLRTNYFKRDNGDILAFTRDYISPEINFRSLDNDSSVLTNKYLASVMGQDFKGKIDISNSCPVHFTIYREERGIYALLITQLFITSFHWDPQKLLEQMFPDDGVFKINLPEQVSTFPHINLHPSEEQKLQEKTYWNSIVTPSTEFANIPNDQRLSKERIFETEYDELNADVFFKIKDKVDCNNYEIVGFLETAWAFLVSNLIHSRDFCIKMLGKDNVIFPVGFNFNDNITVKDLVLSTHKQIEISNDVNKISTHHLMNMALYMSMINHYLDFHNFTPCFNFYDEEYSRQGAYLLDARIIDLGHIDFYVHFIRTNDGIGISYSYNTQSFRFETIEKIKNLFPKICLFLISNWENKANSIIRDNIITKNECSDKDYIYQKIIKYIVRCFMNCDIFVNFTNNDLISIAKASRLKALKENEILVPLNSEQNYMYILADGKLIRYRRGADDWLSPLDVLKPYSTVNEFVLLGDKSKLCVDVYTQKAYVIAIPTVVIHNLIKKGGRFSFNLCSKLLKELDKYQNRWMKME